VQPGDALRDREAQATESATRSFGRRLSHRLPLVEPPDQFDGQARAGILHEDGCAASPAKQAHAHGPCARAVTDGAVDEVG
jgi:hypothetical protein